MRVLLTGGTGYVGSAVLESLVRGGHHVDALVRNTEGAATVQARGAHPVLGDLSQPASWRGAAAAADGSIHAAAQSGARARQVDEMAVGVLPSAPPKGKRFLGFTPGVWVLGPAPGPGGATPPLHPAGSLAVPPARPHPVPGAGA